MRLPITALATALLVSILPAATSAQTAFGVLNVWLKKLESADAPNDQQVTLYTKSKALVIGMDHYSVASVTAGGGAERATLKTPPEKQESKMANTLPGLCLPHVFTETTERDSLHAKLGINL
jgi:hypothetical protein